MAIPMVGDIYSALSTASLQVVSGLLVSLMTYHVHVLHPDPSMYCPGKDSAGLHPLSYLCIPKDQVWSGHISEVSPISLLEH